MHPDHYKTTKKEQKKVTSSGGWGMFDTIAAVSQGNKEAKKHAQSMSQTKDEKWGHNTAQTAVNNAIDTGADKGGWNAKDEQVAVTGEPFVKEEVTTTDGGVPKEKVKKTVTVDDKKKKYRWLNPQTGKVELKDIPFLMRMTGATGYKITPNGDIVLVDKLGSTLQAFKLVDLASDVLGGLVGFKPEKAFGDMGNTGKAALYNKISKMDPDEFRTFLNRKGNLDRIMEYYGDMDFEAQGNFEDILKTGDSQGFAELIRSSAGNSEDFQTALLKEQKPQDYWNRPENHPQTMGALEEAYAAGIRYIDGYGPVEKPEGPGFESQGIASLGGGTETQPVDPTDPDAGMMPSGTYLASQYNKALMPDPNMDPYKNAMYATGIEQQHLAGGYWDPNTHQWVDQQGPWGTQNLWQGANPTIPEVIGLAEGGPARAPSSKVTQGGGGLFDFKPYGF